MVSIYQNNNLITNNRGEAKSLEFRGLSTDEKPTELDDQNIPNGSIFIEIDTGSVYLYDLTNEEWKEI